MSSKDGSWLFFWVYCVVCSVLLVLQVPPVLEGAEEEITLAGTIWVIKIGVCVWIGYMIIQIKKLRYENVELERKFQRMLYVLDKHLSLVERSKTIKDKEWDEHSPNMYDQGLHEELKEEILSFLRFKQQEKLKEEAKHKKMMVDYYKWEKKHNK